MQGSAPNRSLRSTLPLSCAPIRSTTYPPGGIFITQGSCSSMTQILQFPQGVCFMIGQVRQSVTSRLGRFVEKVKRKTMKNSVKLAGSQSASMWTAGKAAYCSDGWKTEHHWKCEGFRSCEQVQGDTRFPVCLCRGPCGFQGPAAEHKYITSESHRTLLKDKPGPGIWTTTQKLNLKRETAFKQAVLCSDWTLCWVTGSQWTQPGRMTNTFEASAEIRESITSVQRRPH